jgi:hypothetical protein
MAKSWTDRLNAADAPKLKPSPRTVGDVVEGQMMLVPTARQVDEFMRTIPAGSSMDVKTLRKAMAHRHGAEVTCPVYTGYHLRTVAEAAHEALQRGVPIAEIAPFWRVLDEATPTTERLTFGAEFVRARRQAEGLED